ncbi:MULTISPECIES: hypothetical protein [Streptococcus]|jgi:hypothetical protein|nr:MULTISPECIES: hypothetical protein [Streptococcus]MBS6319280.1 hypothetical protein [Streptococcus salivarius]MBZ5837591.1 hypothetical protein [Streptococcus salivarius]OFO01162.1 hypothetical protein HMPREF2607_02300 [Streptococcus sp. HMSC078H03]
MSVQHTNFNTSQDKGKTGQEFNNQELIKKNAPDNRVASIFLAVAFYLAIVYFYLAIVYFALFFINPWGILLIIFLAPSLISFIIATILTGIGRKKASKNFLYTSIVFYVASILLAYDPDWGVFRVIPILLTILVTIGTVLFKQDNEQDNK